MASAARGPGGNRLLLDARRNGARMVVGDPYRSRTARVADEHLQPLPGTECHLLDGSRHHVCQAPLPELPCTIPGMAPRCSARTTST